ncbi:hypothetical protein [Pyramidobacter sp.]|uniref:hypothetical protein n=1 Tax=Pyramidobacter sp. TaxID=1943581 RepID=UPI0039C73008
MLPFCLNISTVKAAALKGIKTVFCGRLCGIHQCALKKDVTTCGDCPGLGKCQTVGKIIANNLTVLKKSKRTNHINLTGFRFY